MAHVACLSQSILSGASIVMVLYAGAILLIAGSSIGQSLIVIGCATTNAPFTHGTLLERTLKHNSCLNPDSIRTIG